MISNHVSLLRKGVNILCKDVHLHADHIDQFVPSGIQFRHGIPHHFDGSVPAIRGSGKIVGIL